MLTRLELHFCKSSLRGTRNQSLLRHGHSSNALTNSVPYVFRKAGFPLAIRTGICRVRSLHRLRGDKGIRTLDPLLAGQVLSQLSYTPGVSSLCN